MKSWWFIWLFLPNLTLAQDLPALDDSQLEAIAERNDREEASGSAVDPFIQKIYLNEAGKMELQEIPWLNPRQIDQFLLYRERLGRLVSIYELQAIPGWDISLIKKLQPFISLDWKGEIKTTLRERLHNGQRLAYIRAGRVIESAAGFLRPDSAGFMGSPYQVQVRYGYNYRNKLGWGISAVNQTGESFGFQNAKKGFDQLGLHFFVRDIKHMRILALGNFKINFGQGLICWQGVGFSKSGDVMAIKREAPIIQPSVSGAENGFFTGVAIAFQKKKWEFGVFAAKNRKDANMESDTVRSVLFSGLHRTAAEIEKKGNLLVLSAGIQAGFGNKSVSVHFNALAEKWNHPIFKRPAPYNLFAPSGSLFVNEGVDFAFTYRNMHVFGEVALNERNALASLTGIMISLDKRVSMAILARKISPSYYAWNGNAFTENSFPTNETGLYSSISMVVSKKITVNTYLDLFQIPWLKFRQDSPGSGRSSFIQLIYTPEKSFQFYIRFRTELTYQNKNPSLYTNETERRVQNYIRAHLNFKLNEKQSFQCRMEATNVNYNMHGMIFYVELKQQFKLFPLRTDIRIQYTSTDDYSSRLYTYESDLPYTYSVFPQYGNYIRYYLNISIPLPQIAKMKNSFSLYIKASQNFKLDEKPYGTGLSAIEGFSKTNVVAQVIYRK